RLRGYVRHITDEHRIDISLQQTGLAQVKDSAQTLLQLLHENGGRLPLNDASDPAEVRRLTAMSKKTFKRSVGMLLKQGRIAMDDRGIEIRR
ncbi:MAG: hypothetical protein K2G10_06390, partial [Alistipes sp.]|nr:hypothetical protein [Alistipes sp.]